MEIATVPAHYVADALDALERQGSNREKILRRIGLSNALLSEDKARIPRSDYLRVTGYLALKLQDECFGLLEEPMKPGTFAMLCHASISCETLEHFLKRFLKYSALTNSCVSFKLSREGSLAKFTVHPIAGKVYGEDLYIMLSLAIVHRLSSWAIDQTIQLEETALCRSRPYYASDYNMLFGAPVTFGRDENSISFNASYLDSHISQNADTLQQFLKNSSVYLMSGLDHDHSFTSSVVAMIKKDVAGRFPSFVRVAKALNCAPATLRRKLLMEGSTYQGIKDSVRRDTAIYYLSTKTMSLEDVANKSGFSDTTSFFRAFKRWTGTSPRAYSSL